MGFKLKITVWVVAVLFCVLAVVVVKKDVVVKDAIVVSLLFIMSAIAYGAGETERSKGNLVEAAILFTVALYSGVGVLPGLLLVVVGYPIFGQ